MKAALADWDILFKDILSIINQSINQSTNQSIRIVNSLDISLDCCVAFLKSSIFRRRVLFSCFLRIQEKFSE